MYKLTLGSLNEIKYSSSAEHGLFSGTIETDRVVIVDSDGKYLQTDGNWGTNLKNGLVRTWSATLDKAETDLLKAKYTAKSADTAAVYVYDGIMALQSDYSTVDDFIEYLVDNGVVEIQGYENPKYKLNAVSIKTAGSGYTAETVDVTVPGEAGDTPGVITVTISTGKCASAVVKTAGSYEKCVASQVVDVTATAGSGGKVTVTMALIED